MSSANILFASSTYNWSFHPDLVFEQAFDKHPTNRRTSFCIVYHNYNKKNRFGLLWYLDRTLLKREVSDLIDLYEGLDSTDSPLKLTPILSQKVSFFWLSPVIGSWDTAIQLRQSRMSSSREKLVPRFCFVGTVPKLSTTEEDADITAIQSKSENNYLRMSNSLRYPVWQIWNTGKHRNKIAHGVAHGWETRGIPRVLLRSLFST